MTILLPSTLRLLQDRRPDSVLGALRLLDDCHHDYLAISSNPRRDRAKKQLLRLFDEVNFDLKRVIDHLEHLAPYVDLDFDQAYAIRFGGDKEYARRGEFDRFRRVLELMLDSFEVSRYRIRSDAPFPYLPHNQKRMHVVECAYALSEYWGGPKYVTTPGSDFSLLCSFLNEMISGTRDESMSGAIARFARQKAAQTITPESLGLGPDEDDTHPFDEDRLHWALIAFANFLSVSNAPDVSPSAKYIAMHMAHREAVRAVSSDKTKKKPDEAQGDVTTRMELISRLEGEMRASTIALGRLRRHQDD